MKKIKNITSLSFIKEEFDTFILDLWGVIHNGKKAYSHAVDCIKKLHNFKKNIILISNSSKNNNLTIDKLNDLGFNTNFFSKVITSGQIVFEELKSPTLEWSKKLGNNFYHITNSSKIDKYDFTKGLNKKLVDKLSLADFIIASSINPSTPVLNYTPLLKEAYQRKLPLICANPDYESIEKNQNNERGICSGSLGKLYESFGGKVHILGKPSKYIYEKATKSIINFNKSKTVAIGDSIHHDIFGAYKFGIKSVLITSGIHKDDLKNGNLNDKIDKLSELNIRPDFTCNKLIY